MLIGGQKIMSSKADYIIFLENKITKERFQKEYNSPYLFRKDYRKFSHSNKLKILSVYRAYK